jgi:Rrf2 family protein
MNFNKTTEYTLRILSFMSLNENMLYSAIDLSEKLKIPYRYLRKQMNMLSKQGFIESIQGKQGGYKIAKSLTDISLLDIVNATENYSKENMCFFGFQECPLQNHCSMHDKWGEVRDKTFTILKTTTLHDLKKDNSALILSTK